MSATSAPRSRLFARLAARAPIILDGPTGTALEGRGFQSHPTLWTATAVEAAPTLLAAVHRDYLRAGAELVTANTFRTTAFAAQKAGLADPVETARRWLVASVAIARSVAAEFSSSRAVLGSLAPLADCYSPQDTPPDDVLRREHRRTADWLVAAGSDGILVETQGCGREARIAVAAAVESAAGAMPVLVSFLPDASGARLLDGDDLTACAKECLLGGAQALLVNCAPADVLLQSLSVLRPIAEGRVPIGAYPNAARMSLVNGTWRWQAATDEVNLALAGRALRRAGARIIGACCGFSPSAVAALFSAAGESETA